MPEESTPKCRTCGSVRNGVFVCSSCTRIDWRDFLQMFLGSMALFFIGACFVVYAWTRTFSRQMILFFAVSVIGAGVVTIRSLIVLVAEVGRAKERKD